MEIKTITTKLVKPIKPTPSNLRNYNISFFDEQIPNLNVPLILYYSTAQNDVNANLFNHLETSLSNTLTDFYPLAGRYVRDGSFIDCSDQGALYVQATANFQLAEFLGLAWELKYNMLRDLLPCKVGEAGEVDDPMLYIKVTTFECGGFAIGMCFSHKLCDMSTMCTFINNWATRSQDASYALELEKYTPIFSVPQDFPKRDLTDLSPRFPRTSLMMTNAARIFMFKGNAISKMREKIIFEDNQGHRPSKVQLVLALLWKAFVGMDKANNNGQSKVSFLSQGVNLRNKAVPKLPDNLCGNFVGVAVAQTDTCEGDDIDDLQGFYMILHDSLKKYDSNYAKALTSGEYDVLMKSFLEYSQNIMNSDVNFYGITSWCKFSFNKADFGWGKPVWKSTGQFGAQNFVVMMDDQEGDGIEAWVHFDEKRMGQFEQDPDIKAYAIYTPSQ